MPRSQGTSRKGKPKAADRASGMGRALAKAQTKKFVVKSNGSSRHGAGMQASGAHDIGISSVGEAGIKSLLEMDSLSDFILQAQMANREYNVEREQFLVLDQVSTQYDPHAKRVSFGGTADRGETKFEFSELSVPRRPKWDTSMTAQDLEQQENEAFLQWRRSIAAQEDLLNRRQQSNMVVSGSLFATSPLPQAGQHHPQQQVTVTPFEKNIQVWKQLWRVLEQSACLIQIVDARHPLFYFSKDLQTYATNELGKPMIILLNKSDFLTPKQRTMWHSYLTKLKIYHIFFSAKLEQDKLDQQVSSTTVEGEESQAPQLDGVKDTDLSPKDETSYYGHDQLLTRSQLHDALREFANAHQCRPTTSTGTTASRYGNRIQFGMVGFPNVGKSSVINVLVGSSKHTHGGVTRVGVASQPGKTKHFQTVLIPDRDDIMLCDCPGLVFPSFVSSTADLIAAGVYPIDQMRDIYVVMELLTQRIRLRDIWNIKYGVTLPLPLQNASSSTIANGGTDDGFDQVYRSLPPPTAREVLDTYCISRSLYAASSGIPDHQTAARTIIKDYVKGKLLYCHPPPLSSPMASQNDEAEFIKETLLKELEAELRKNTEHHGSATTNARTKVLQSLEANARLLTASTSTKNNVDGSNVSKNGRNNNDDSLDISSKKEGNTTSTSISPDVAAMVEDDLLLLDTIEGLESLATKGNKKTSAAAAQKKGGKGKQGKRDRIKARKQQGNQSTVYFSSSTPVGAM